MFSRINIRKALMKLKQLFFYLFHHSHMIIIQLRLFFFEIPIISQLSKIQVSPGKSFTVNQPFLQMLPVIYGFNFCLKFIQPGLELVFLSHELSYFALHVLVNQKFVKLFIINSTTMTEVPQPQTAVQTSKNVIFEDEDFQKLAIAQRKLITAPLKITGFFMGMHIISKYIKFSELLPNPLAKKAQKTNFGQFFRNRSKLVFFHTTLFLGIATFLGAFFAKQINKYKIFTKYRREVTYYMRWKLQREVKSQAESMD